MFIKSFHICAIAFDAFKNIHYLEIISHLFITREIVGKNAIMRNKKVQK
jgi:hypothetical protein